MKIKGVWMWPGSILKRGAKSVIGNCARAGITDIYFLTKGLTGKVAFQSAYAPRISESDLLSEVIEEAHKSGIRVHAWLTSTCDETYKQQHPESGRCHYVRGRDRELISLADTGYIQYMEKVVGEICRRYAVDGLHLDYIRYNHLLYGWAEEDLARYSAEGADTTCLHSLMQRALAGKSFDESVFIEAFHNGDESVLAFARARRKDVFGFAKKLICAAKAEKSELLISAALMPEGAYDDTAFADLHYGQNYEDAAELYDYVLPMAYSQAFDKEALWVKQVAEGTLKHNLKTVMGLHAYEGGTASTLQKDTNILQETPVDGICLFRENTIVFAYAKGRQLFIYNAMDENVDCIVVNGDEKPFTLNETIVSGEEKQFQLPESAKLVQAFSKQGECCVYLINE